MRSRSFQTPTPFRVSQREISARLLSHDPRVSAVADRRSLAKTIAATVATAWWSVVPDLAVADNDEAAFVQRYADFAEAPGDVSYRYKDVTAGTGAERPESGDRVVYDWTGYTIGYFGRPFERREGPQGGAFDQDTDHSRAVLGSGAVVPALDDALRGMRAGGVRQILVPYGNASGYPTTGDPDHEKVGPRPSTFSGRRALNFVLENPRVDRTLLFNVKVVRVDKKDGRGSFARGPST